MIDKIKITKDRILDFMDQEIGKYGNSRMDVKQVGELADIVKDLAEAEYYCSVSKAMEGGSDTQGYTRPMDDRMGYGGMGGRAGYGGSMGHSDPVSAIRDMFMTADPDTRSMIRNEMSKLMGM